MSTPHIETYVDEHGRLTVRATQEAVLLTKEEAQRVADLIAALRHWCKELRAMADINHCHYCDLPCQCHGADVDGCALDNELRELGVDI